MPRMQIRGEGSWGEWKVEMVDVELVREMDEMEWGRCVEERQEMSGSGYIEMCENGSRCGEWCPFIPPSPTQHILQHHNTLLIILKKVQLIEQFLA